MNFTIIISGILNLPITQSKYLIKVTDVLGRETKGTKNEPLFYIYDDGSVERKLFFK